MRRLTQKIWEELADQPVWSLTDLQLAQMRRSNRGGSCLRMSIIAEQRRRDLLIPGSDKERIKRLCDYPDSKPIVHHISELDDFRCSLAALREKIDELIDQHGAGSQIFVDAGYNNVSVSVEVQPSSET